MTAVDLTHDDAPAETLDAFDYGDTAPWYRSRRLAVALMIVGVLVAEFAWMAQARDPLAAQRAEVAALGDAHKAELGAAWERFQKFTPEERQRIRDLHAQLETDADPAGLRTTLAAYQTWKSGLSPVQSAALVNLAPQERIGKIIEFTAEQSAGAARSVSDEDAKKIVAWLENQVDGFQDKLLEAMPADARKRFESFDRKQRNWALIMSFFAYRAAGGPGGPRLDNVSPEALAELRNELSPTAQRAWDAAPTIDDRKALLVDWIRQSIYRTMPHRDGSYMARVTDEQLREFFDKQLTEAERQRYLSLPREEMNSQLRRDYFRRNAMKEPGFGDGPFGRPPFGRPGGFGPGNGPNNRGPGDNTDRRSSQGSGGPRTGPPTKEPPRPQPPPAGTPLS